MCFLPLRNQDFLSTFWRIFLNTINYLFISHSPLARFYHSLCELLSWHHPWWSQLLFERLTSLTGTHSQLGEAFLSVFYLKTHLDGAPFDSNIRLSQPKANAVTTYLSRHTINIFNMKESLEQYILPSRFLRCRMRNNTYHNYFHSLIWPFP